MNFRKKLKDKDLTPAERQTIFKALKGQLYECKQALYRAVYLAITKDYKTKKGATIYVCKSCRRFVTNRIKKILSKALKW